MSWRSYLSNFTWNSYTVGTNGVSGRLRLYHGTTSGTLVGDTGALTVVAGVLATLAVITYFGRWKWLWDEWLTSLDPKKIGVMYIVVASVMFFRGGLDAAMIWLQQSLSVGGSQGYLDASHFHRME